MLVEEKMQEVLDLIDQTINSLQGIKESMLEGSEKERVKLSDLVVKTEEPASSNSINGDIIRDYEQGKSASELQQHYGISSGTLYSILRRNEVELRHGTTSTEQKIKDMGEGKVEAIIGEYLGGAPNRAIQEYYNINKHTLYTILDTYGVDELKGEIINE